jgi:hypothetical protein
MSNDSWSSLNTCDLELNTLVFSISISRGLVHFSGNLLPYLQEITAEMDVASYFETFVSSHQINGHYMRENSAVITGTRITTDGIWFGNRI